jgi:hypothetical protein
MPKTPKLFTFEHGFAENCGSRLADGDIGLGIQLLCYD